MRVLEVTCVTYAALSLVSQLVEAAMSKSLLKFLERSDVE